MLTSRGYWFFAIVVAMLAAAVLADRAIVSLELVALTLLLWFCWQWLLFTVRAWIISRRLQLTREIRDERGPVGNLWAGRPFQVLVQLRLDAWLDLPHVAMADHIPHTADCDLELTRTEGPVDAENPLALHYSLHCASPGKVRFEGVRVQLADVHGLFYHVTFVPGVAVYRVLPALADAEGHTAVKRHNLLPPPGIHRLRRPGSGSELLDLRDYLPGDPPKTIAWKVSARRDRLITKEFESEVPVRCTLFVDTSHSVRVGPPGENALTRLVEIAATVAQAATGSRDLIGLCLFDETDARSIRPARGGRHLVHLLNELTDAAGLAPSMGQADVTSLLPLAYAFAQEVYPQMMRPKLNSFPFWLPWLSPRPASTQSQPTWRDRVYGRQPLLWRLYLAGWLIAAPAVLANLDSLSGTSLWLVLVILPGLYLGLGIGWLVFLAAAFRDRRRSAAWRKRLAALFSVQYGLAPGGLGCLLEDDEQFSLLLQRFLAEHHVPFSPSLYDRQGHYLFASPQKVTVLANALVRSVGRGHDNELFVLLADLLELGDRLDPLLRAVKVALARHHQVLVICPWPPAIEPPGREGRGVAPAPAAPGPESKDSRHLLREAMRQVSTRRFHRAFHHARRTFARLGVPMVSARSGDMARVILDRLNELRGLGRKR